MVKGSPKSGMVKLKNLSIGRTEWPVPWPLNPCCTGGVCDIWLEKVNLNWFVSAKEWLTLVSAIVPLIKSEYDNVLQDLPRFSCFLEGVTEMAKCALSGRCHRPRRGWAQRGSHTGWAQLEQTPWMVCAWFGSVPALPEAAHFLLVSTPRISSGAWPGLRFFIRF